MPSLNRVEIIGHLGRDPETGYTPGGNCYCKFSVATSEKWKDKQTGEKKEKTEWHNIVSWGKLAEICGQYASKGRLVYVDGKLQTRSWDQDGSKRYITEILANTVLMLDRESTPSNKPQADPAPNKVKDDDDDIPF